MTIKTENSNDRTMLLTILIALGAKWHGPTTNVDEINKTWPQHYWHTVNIHNIDGLQNGDGSSLSGSSNDRFDYAWPEDVATIIEFLTPISQEFVVLGVGDDNYTAEVTDNGIEVGCQTITFGKFKEIVKAVDGYNASL
tara:strand:+ start:5208 stop:5624 length:417 start_codon:yes stop_codon:yes gene_type:complete